MRSVSIAPVDRAGLPSLTAIERGAVLVYRNPSLCLYNVNWRALLPRLPPDYDVYRHSPLAGASSSSSSSFSSSSLSSAAGARQVPGPLASLVSPFEAVAGVNVSDEAAESQTQWVEVALNADRELCARIDRCDARCPSPPVILGTGQPSPAPLSSSSARQPSCWSSALCQQCALSPFGSICSIVDFKLI